MIKLSSIIILSFYLPITEMPSSLVIQGDRDDCLLLPPSQALRWWGLAVTCPGDEITPAMDLMLAAWRREEKRVKQDEVFEEKSR